MVPRTQDAPGYYVWEVPGQRVAVHLHLSVVDHLSAEVIHGLGANPKRGAEVGGLLLGTIEPGSPSIVRVEEFQSIACEYRRGPSYVFTEDDSEAFERAWACWQPSVSPKCYAVGYFRGNTRDKLELTSDDIELLDQFFPGAASVALLIVPFATKASAASFFYRADGVFQEKAPLEFPFRRYELMGEELPQRRPLTDRGYAPEMDTPISIVEEEVPDEPVAPPMVLPPLPPRVRQRSFGWIWFPLSILFLMLGAALGYVASTLPAVQSWLGTSPNLSLGLSATQNGENLLVKWNGQAPVLQWAQRGVLEIEENGTTKPIELDAAQLRNGTLVYRNSSSLVHFRLTVFPSDRLTVSETVAWTR